MIVLSFLLPVLDVLRIALDAYLWVIIIFVALSWLISFGIISGRNDFVLNIMKGLKSMTEPALRPIRRLLPQTPGIDFSPIVLSLIIFFLQSELGVLSHVLERNAY